MGQIISSELESYPATLPSWTLPGAWPVKRPAAWCEREIQRHFLKITEGFDFFQSVFGFTPGVQIEKISLRVAQYSHRWSFIRHGTPVPGLVFNLGALTNNITLFI